jgi:hypothetical protein
MSDWVYFKGFKQLHCESMIVEYRPLNNFVLGHINSILPSAADVDRFRIDLFGESRLCASDRRSEVIQVALEFSAHIRSAFDRVTNASKYTRERG